MATIEELKKIPEANVNPTTIANNKINEKVMNLLNV